MIEESKFLLERAGKFLNYALSAFKNEDFEICAFNLEQSAQLYLKYTLSVLVGGFPKTHSLNELIKNVIKISTSKKLKKIFHKERNTIFNLEQSYITSSYIPTTFTKAQVKNMFCFVKELSKILKKLWTT